MSLELRPRKQPPWCIQIKFRPVNARRRPRYAMQDGVLLENALSFLLLYSSICHLLKDAVSKVTLNQRQQCWLLVGFSECLLWLVVFNSMNETQQQQLLLQQQQPRKMTYDSYGLMDLVNPCESWAATVNRYNKLSVPSIGKLLVCWLHDNKSYLFHGPSQPSFDNEINQFPLIFRWQSPCFLWQHRPTRSTSKCGWYGGCHPQAQSISYKIYQQQWLKT